MKISLSLDSAKGLLPSLRFALFWSVSLFLWGTVLFLLYNLLYGKNGVLDYVELSNEIAMIGEKDKITDEEREEIMRKFRLTD